MSVLELVPAAVLLLAGSLILLRSIDKVIASGYPRRIADDVARIHGDAYIWLLRKGIFRFPGSGLVASSRQWIAGELIVAAAILLAVTADLSRASAATLLVFGGVAGTAAVFISFREEARRRLDEIRSALPVASYMMSLMLEAGMGSPAALQEVVKALPKGPLAIELEGIARSRALGISRKEAIDASRDRVPIDDYRAFLNLVQQGERLGIALSQGLRDLSSRMLESQAHRAETIAQKASVKLLFPLVIFIFPSVFLVIMAPVILNLLDMLGR